MRILVTGGAGFIGRHLVRSLVLEHELKIYDNFSSSNKKDVLDNVKLVDADILDYDRLVSECKNFDCVIHLAAKSSVSESLKDPELVNRTNIEGTRNVLDACLKNNIKKFLFASSAAVYGNAITPIFEDTKKKPLSPYGKSKMECEELITEYAKSYEMNCISLRIFNVYGIGQNKNYAGVISKFYESILHDESLVIYGDGNQTRDFISIHDVVEAFSCSLNNIMKVHGESFNIATGISTSINQLARIMIDVSGKQLDIIHHDAKEADIRYSFADVRKAKNNLNFEARIKLVDGLKELFSVS